MIAAQTQTDRFRQLHAPGQLLVLPNAWDAGSARVIESGGAAAIATTSSGVSWSHGYPDGNALPTHILATAVAEIRRVITVPLSVDIEGGYSNDARSVGETVAAVIDAGAVGINIEDGSEPPDLLCAKITAAKTAAAHAGVDLFVNARTDVYLRKLVPDDRALTETIERARRYRAAGCDGVFVPYLHDAQDIRTIAAAIELPLNVMVVPALPPPPALRRLGVRRISGGAALALAAYGVVRRAAMVLLSGGTYDTLYEHAPSFAEINRLMVAARGQEQVVRSAVPSPR